MLLLARADLETLLTPADVVDALADAFARHARRQTLVPPRTVVPVTDDGVLILMPAAMDAAGGGDGALGTKLVTYYAGNRARGHATIHASYVLMERASGKPVALLEGTYLTALRTGAASALAARYLARPDARRVACFGAGVQAEFQLRCLAAVRPVQGVAVIGRDRARAQAFAGRMTALLGVPVAVADDPREAVKRADIVTCATTSTTPVVHGVDLAPGAHVDAVGAFSPKTREVDSETVRRARIVVDSYAGALEDAGDLLIPLAEGLIDRSHIVAELSELVGDPGRGRTTEDQVTLFKSVGFALEDLATARLAYTRAIAHGIGTELGW